MKKHHRFDSSPLMTLMYYLLKSTHHMTLCITSSSAHITWHYVLPSQEHTSHDTVLPLMSTHHMTLCMYYLLKSTHHMTLMYCTVLPPQEHTAHDTNVCTVLPPQEHTSHDTNVQYYLRKSTHHLILKYSITSARAHITWHRYSC